MQPGTAKRHEISSFNDFLLADDSDSFDAKAPIDRYHDYCGARFTPFSECSDVVVWWESCRIIGKPISQMGWDMIGISAMSSECKRVFSSAGRLITLVRNRLKEDIIKVSKCLSAWYKQE